MKNGPTPTGSEPKADGNRRTDGASDHTLSEAIELLVDDELDPAGRAALFARLEDDPSGWRRCAHGLLEARLWERSLATCGEGVPRDGRRPDGRGDAPRRRATRGLRPAWVACGLVAALVLSFIAGHQRGALTGVAAFAGPLEPPPPPGGAAGAAPVVMAAAHPFLQPAIASDGTLVYRTRSELPRFVLDAIQRAGHRVERVRQVVRLTPPTGDAFEVPVTETLIAEDRPI